MVSRSKPKDNLSPVLTEYCREQLHSESLYGENTMVMMQIGSFLEIYEIRLENGQRIGNAHCMAGCLNQMKETQLATSGKDTKYFKGKRVDRIIRYGFPLIDESKKTYVGVATNMGFTVPVYYQKGFDASRSVETRVCTEVWSPMVRPSDSECSSRWFVAIILSSVDATRAEIGCINPVTRTYVSRTVTREGAICTDAYDMVSVYSPSEVVFWVNTEKGPDVLNSLKRTWGIHEQCAVRVLYVPGKDIDVGYDIRSILLRYVRDSTVAIGDGSIPVSIARGLDYMRNIIPQSIEGITFCKEHRDAGVVIMENQPLRQLNIVSNELNHTSHISKRTESVLRLYDYTVTKMGKRIHERRIMTPITDYSKLSQRQELGKWFECNEDRIQTWKNILKTIPDMGSLFSANVYGGVSYELVWKCMAGILNVVSQPVLPPIDIPLSESKEFCRVICEQLATPDSIATGGANIGGYNTFSYTIIEDIYPDVPFKEGYPNAELHELHSELKCTIDKLSLILDGMNTYGSSTRVMPKNAKMKLAIINHNYWITGSKVTSGRLVKTFSPSAGSSVTLSWKDASVAKVDSFSGRGSPYMLSDKTQIKLGLDEGWVSIQSILKKATALRKQIDERVASCWVSYTQMIRKSYESLIREMAHIIGSIDVACSSAIALKKNGYTWPTLVDSSGQDSWVTFEDLRHPLIESIRQDVKYVPHTLSIGNDSSDSFIGRLVFGVNSSGKSSLMKALGISVILAQSGYPVPAKCMKLSMYSSIFTRILGNDDLFRGLSTFRVEADELTRILRKADSKSLVLGDELCSGTEQIGAESLVAASVLTLLRRRSSFLFATHLHRIRDIPDLTEHMRLGWNHLRVDVDDTGMMRMDRRLFDGAGPRGYAIDFVERMGGDSATMKEAKRIRDMITSEDFSIRTARAWKAAASDGRADAEENTTSWNPKAQIQTVCQICKERPAVETDHIIPRQDANMMGGIDGIGNVHSGGNLVGLCHICHERKTRSEIEIHGYEECFDPESGGTQRSLKWSEKKQDNVIADADEEEDTFIESTIRRMASVGKTARQIQRFLSRNGHKLRLTEINLYLK